MRLKKFIISLCFVLLFYFSFCYFNNFKNEDCVVSSLNTDSKGPIIYDIFPYKCQQFIVAKPEIKISYKDESGIDKSSVKLFINYKDVTKKCTITDKYIYYLPDTKFKRGSQIIRLEISDILKNKSEYEWYFTVGTPIYNHYRGLIHAHTEASDGHGSYNDAYYLARDKANLDFFAITEHSNLLDNHLDCNINNASFSSKWNDLIKSRDLFYCKDKFIALSGFEMTYPFKVKNPIGHINIYNSNGFVSSELPNMTLENFYDLIYEQDDLIGQFNHPCEKFGSFNNFKYSAHGDYVISLIEVGNGYNKDMTKNIRSHDMYQLALDKGWHLAPTCNQDNHRVDFGIANEFRTVVLATDLNKDALYDALRNMRVYATEDKNLKIEYAINNLPMGSTIKNTSKLNFNVSAIDSDEIDKINEIQVISNNGEIVKSKKFNSNMARLEFSLKSSKNKFYYIKIIQNKDKISVTAPIWVE
ncbi:CehA/McbA family metallohydrolase [Romboutsia sp. 13368]|uniref:CehA/McbA family metallohydrolase n=1 Tax=Romboutsia sp. 13368 TaxID=2708053 RepID=UPI0025F77D32|nr:CehA/McbA family metallohydrolase [Romboutsia sp. 13368]